MKIATRANFFGTITNTRAATPSAITRSFTETINLPKGTTTVNGISYHYIVDGQGQVFAEVGHKISVTATGEVTLPGRAGRLGVGPRAAEALRQPELASDDDEERSERAGPRPALFV